MDDRADLMEQAMQYFDLHPESPEEDGEDTLEQTGEHSEEYATLQKPTA